MLSSSKKPNQVPLTLKLSLLLMLPMIISMVLLGAVVVTSQSQLLQDQANEYGNTVAHQLAESAQEPVLTEDKLGLDVMTSNLVVNSNVLGAAVYSSDGVLLSAAGNMATDETILSITEARPAHPGNWLDSITESDTTRTYKSQIEFKSVNAGSVEVNFSETLLKQSMNESIKAIAVATLLLCILSISMAYALSKRLSKPIYDLVDVSKQVARGNYNFKINERRNDEIGEIYNSFNNLAEGLLVKSQVEKVFSRYVSDNIAEKILANLGEVTLGGQRVTASVLFADIAGFTSLSASLGPDQTVDLLNDYFSCILNASKRFNGHIDKFIGDCAMVVFGVPGEDKNHTFNAIACAVLIQRLIEVKNASRRKDGMETVKFKIGVNSGEMLAGNMGSHERMEYTVIGDSVNLASRLSSVAGSGQIAIQEDLLKNQSISSLVLTHSCKSIYLRGKEGAVNICIVDGLVGTINDDIQSIIDEITSKRDAA